VIVGLLELVASPHRICIPGANAGPACFGTNQDLFSSHVNMPPIEREMGGYRWKMTSRVFTYTANIVRCRAVACSDRQEGHSNGEYGESHSVWRCA
jgi:hypothetical protein